MGGIASKEFNPYSDLKPSLSDPTAAENFQSRLSSERFQPSGLYQPPVTFTTPVNPPTQFFAKSEQVNGRWIVFTLFIKKKDMVY
jgi:hypothetical protein